MKDRVDQSKSVQWDEQKAVAETRTLIFRITSHTRYHCATSRQKITRRKILVKYLNERRVGKILTKFFGKGLFVVTTRISRESGVRHLIGCPVGEKDGFSDIYTPWPWTTSASRFLASVCRQLSAPVSANYVLFFLIFLPLYPHLSSSGKYKLVATFLRREAAEEKQRRRWDQHWYIHD